MDIGLLLCLDVVADEKRRQIQGSFTAFRLTAIGTTGMRSRLGFVRARKASSRAGLVISRPLRDLSRESISRTTFSALTAVTMVASPLCSTLVTVGRVCRSSLERLVRQRILRPPLLRLISAGVPSQMTRPLLMTMMRSARASASSR